MWPPIKVQLFFRNYNLYLSKDLSTVVQPLPQRKGLLKKISKVLGYLNLYNRKFQTSDVVFSEALTHYATFQNQKVSKFTFPIEKYLRRTSSKNLSITRLLYGGGISRDMYEHDELIDINELMRVSRLLNRISGPFSPDPINLKNLEEVYFYLKENNLSFFDSYNELLTWIQNLYVSIENYRKLYIKILKQRKPKLIIELCSYNLPNFAINVAARDLGIATMEIMHGGMGNLHVAYSGWDSIPQCGYNTLPQKIWVWDQESAVEIQKWMSKQQFHSCFVGGNPWLDFIINEQEQYIEYFKNKSKKIVLYTLQFDNVEEYIFQAVQKTSDEYEWWFRLHPRKLHGKEEIVQKLKEYNILGKVNIEEANTLPLPLLLKHCSIHLSEYSGSIIEAALLNKQSIILSSIGVESYKAYIESGICVVCTQKNAEDLVKKIYEMNDKIVLEPQSKLEYSTIFNDILKRQ